MKSFKQVVNEVFSTKSVGILIFIFTAIALTAALSSRYYMHHSIIENGVSKKDITATRTIKIEDTEKTIKLRNEISKKIAPIMVPIQDDFISNNLDKDLNEVEIIRNTNDSVEIKSANLAEYFNLSENDAAGISSSEYLAHINKSHFDKIKQISKTTLSNILAVGISDTDIQDNFDEIFKANTIKYTSSDDYALCKFLIKNIISPNLVIDEDATEISRKNAYNSVKPVIVTFKAGDKIVSAGQIVSKLQKDALKQCGYNVIQLNISGIIGIFLIVLISLFITAYYIEKIEPQFKKKECYALFSAMMILLSTIAAAFPNYIALLPVATFTIIIGIFLNTKVSLISTLSILCAISLSLQFEPETIALTIFGTLATIYALNLIQYRSSAELIRVGLITSIVYVICLVGTTFLEYNLDELNTANFGLTLLLIFANGILSSMLALGLLPLIESTFKISTRYGLMELANSNNPLLQKLREKAPGTDHHSQMVAILAEAGAEAIGANTILTKIGALFHDVGKVNRPLFFFENQSYYGIENPHEQFSPKFSKMVITTHPKDGVEEAKKYNIPPVIYPFILEHHGDSIVSYFYNEAVKQEGAENVSEEEFRYNAPRPSSKESAIIMLADSVESAVRSLKGATFEEIDAKVNSIVNGKLLDGQLSDSPITLKDIKTIIATFNRVLKGMHHQRIKYHEDFETIQENVNKSEEKKDAN